MFHVAEKPSRDLVWGNQKAHIQQKRLLDHLASFFGVYFYIWSVLNIDRALKNALLYFQCAFGVLRLFVCKHMMIVVCCDV